MLLDSSGAGSAQSSGKRKLTPGHLHAGPRHNPGVSTWTLFLPPPLALLSLHHPPSCAAELPSVATQTAPMKGAGLSLKRCLSPQQAPAYLEHAGVLRARGLKQ